MGSIITVENLGKKYTIGHQKQGEYKTFRDTLSHSIRSACQRLRHPLSPNIEEVDTEDFWALKNINFDVQQGDRVGIIGRNGAGKSTLLKILSRITHPTTGKIHIKGRVSSLLEVGTGFHPELTGRENIFLNGAILGMTKSDIRLRYDEIVAFAEIEKFLDTPVKRYSSGMYVRLAFAVAAHLEPEILLVDEVLAVGDFEFQKKCLGKMSDVSGQGRTILFVSHNLGAIQSLCNKSILLQSGKVAQIGVTRDVVTNYLQEFITKDDSADLKARTDREGTGDLVFNSLVFFDKEGVSVDSIRCEDRIFICFGYDNYISEHNSAYFLLSINNMQGQTVLFLDSRLIKDFPSKIDKSGKVAIKLSPDFGLMPGQYYVNIAAFVNDDMADYLIGARSLNVIKGAFFETGKLIITNGVCLVKQDWDLYHD